MDQLVITAVAATSTEIETRKKELLASHQTQTFRRRLSLLAAIAVSFAVYCVNIKPEWQATHLLLLLIYSTVYLLCWDVDPETSCEEHLAALGVVSIGVCLLGIGYSWVFSAPIDTSAAALASLVFSAEVLFISIFNWETTANRGLRDLAALTEQPQLCSELLEVCQKHTACDAYRLAVIESGRNLTVGEAKLLINTAREWQEGETARESERLRLVNCALLRAREPLADLAS